MGLLDGREESPGMARKFEEPKAKPATDAYTGMLAVSFLALLLGCTFLYLDYAQYPATGPAKLDTAFKDRSAPDQIEPKGKGEKEDKEKDEPKEPPEKKDDKKDGANK
jgi:hypothetical protein